MKHFTHGTPEQWREFILEMQSGRTLEIDESIFFYWLEVLPPVYMNKCKMIDVLDNGKEIEVDCSFGFAEGHSLIIDFWKSEGRFFCKQSKELKAWD